MAMAHGLWLNHDCGVVIVERTDQYKLKKGLERQILITGVPHMYKSMCLDGLLSPSRGIAMITNNKVGVGVILVPHVTGLCYTSLELPPKIGCFE